MALMAKASCRFLLLAVFLGGPALGGQKTAAPAARTADFTGNEFGDFRYLARFLAAKGPNYPVSWRLGPRIREYLKSWKGQEIPDQMRRAITQDLNVMLSDRLLFGEMKHWYGPNDNIEFPMLEVFSPDDGRFLLWLVRILEAEGAFDPQRTDLSSPASAQLRAMNRILLMGISHRHRKQYSEEPPPPVPPQSGISSLGVIVLSPNRRAMLQPERVVDYLGIQPGMLIADIGAGYGVFTFPLADALRDSGRIYATDVSSGAVSYLKAKAESGGYKNVDAVLVKPDGVDSFYKQHAFDMILAAEVYTDLRNPVSYFDELRLSLKPGSGRLYIIQPNMDAGFTELEFGDFRNVLKTLSAKGERFPAYKRLRPEIRDYLKSWQGQDVPAGLRRGITDDFNAMLLEKSLFEELEGFYGRGSTIMDDHLAHWLVAQLRAEGMLAQGPMSPLASQELHELNRILLTRIFQTRVWRDTLLLDCSFTADRETIVKQLSTAGYTLTRANDKLLPYFYILEFKRVR